MNTMFAERLSVLIKSDKDHVLDLVERSTVLCLEIEPLKKSGI